MSRKDIERLIEEHPNDRELVAALEPLGWNLAQNAQWWAPQLYHRNPEIFLPLIERWVSAWAMRSIPGLEAWLIEAEANRHFRLYRTIYQAKLQKAGWREAATRWASDLVVAFGAAPDKAARRDVIEKHDLWFEISDELAATLYAIDPELTAELLLRRIDRSDWWDIAYEKTAELARERGDDEIYFELYRKTFKADTWKKDVTRLAAEIDDPAQLSLELERRHLSGPSGAIHVGTLVKLLEQRGDDVVPYLERNVADVHTWGNQKEWKALADAARAGGWINVWSIVVRTHFQANTFSDEVARLATGSEPPWERASHLIMIAGAQSGWRRWRWFTTLLEKDAATLYDAFPLICRGAFAPHLHIAPSMPYNQLAKRADEAGDTAMIDFLASRAAVAGGWQPEKLKWYARHYEALDPETFARRAADVLDLMQPPRRPVGRARLVENPVYAVLFSDTRRMAPALERARDLLEAPYEGARRVGLQMIVDAGERGVDIAVANTDHLGAYLLNEASRATRSVALDALALAAERSPEIAASVVERARHALDLRRKRYPRELVIRLIGRVLARWPELRGPREQPVVFEKEATW